MIKNIRFLIKKGNKKASNLYQIEAFDYYSLTFINKFSLASLVGRRKNLANDNSLEK